MTVFESMVARIANGPITTKNLYKNDSPRPQLTQTQQTKPVSHHTVNTNRYDY